MGIQNLPDPGKEAFGCERFLNIPVKTFCHALLDRTLVSAEHRDTHVIEMRHASHQLHRSSKIPFHPRIHEDQIRPRLKFMNHVRRRVSVNHAKTANPLKEYPDKFLIDLVALSDDDGFRVLTLFYTQDALSKRCVA